MIVALHFYFLKTTWWQVSSGLGLVVVVVQSLLLSSVFHLFPFILVFHLNRIHLRYFLYCSLKPRGRLHVRHPGLEMFRLHLQTTKGPSIILFNLKAEVSVRHLNFQDIENMYDAPPSSSTNVSLRHPSVVLPGRLAGWDGDCWQ